MDGQYPALVFILEWVWVPMGLAIMWLFNRVLGMERNVTERRAGINMKLAVLESQQVTLKDNFEDFTERNEKAHQRIEEKIDTHNDRVMKRFDNLAGLIRNGNK